MTGDVMTVLHETAAGAQPLLITTSSELGNRSGGILRALSTGALVLVDDNRVGCRAALMVPPQLIPAVLRSLGIDPDSVPDPGTVRDQLV
jgi:hypothetical protein